jgi:hypothetical protein
VASQVLARARAETGRARTCIRSRAEPSRELAKPWHPPGSRKSANNNRRFQRASEKRMKGLEPSTFCMARTRRESTAAARSRHSVQSYGLRPLGRRPGFR